MDDLVAWVVDVIFDYLCVPFIGDGMYRRGFLAAIVVLFLARWLIESARTARARIMIFFMPIPPSLRPSPSGYTTMLGCLRGVVTLIVIGIVLSVLLSSFILWLSRRP